MSRLAILILALTLTGCMHVYQADGTVRLRPAFHVTGAHVPRWDYVPYIGWRHTLYGQDQSDCFDPENGDVLLACQGCYDANKRPIAGCVPGHYAVSPLKAELDAKINAKLREEHCRRTALSCVCTGLAYPWTAAQKKVSPPCDPSKGDF